MNIFTSIWQNYSYLRSDFDFGFLCPFYSLDVFKQFIVLCTKLPLYLPKNKTTKTEISLSTLWLQLADYIFL